MDKRGLEFETLIKWIIAVVVLIIAALGIMILSGRGSDLLEKLNAIIKFGR
jgi:hypothetical protein